MKSAHLVANPSPRCRNLLSLAAFEVQAGFAGTAQAYVRGVKNCCETGRCAAPKICTHQHSLPVMPVPKIIRFPADAAQRRRSRLALGRGVATPTPFRLPVRESDQAGNYVERHTLSVATLNARGGRLAELLAYWQQLQLLSGGAIADLDSIRLWQMDLLGWMHLVHVGDPDPNKFWLPICGWRVPLPHIDHDSPGVRFDQYPIRLLAETITRDYAVVRETSVPIYQHVHARLSGGTYSYRRLVLPISSNGKVTDRLLVTADFSMS